MNKKLTVAAAATLSLALLVPMTACGKDKVAYLEVALSDSEYYGYCVKPEDTALLASVNELLTEIQGNGTLSSLIAAEDNGTAKDIGAVATTSTNRANELVVATNAEFAPFEYKMGNNFAGVDMQVAKLLANKLEKTLVIIDMDFDAVVLSVANGTCDIGMAGLTISDDRSENVTFSSAYYQSAQYLAYQTGDETFKNCKTTEEVLNAIKGLASGTKAGGATGQTGEAFLKGSADFGYEGFANLDVKSYDSIALAVKALSNGQVKFVVGDCDTIKAAIKGING